MQNLKSLQDLFKDSIFRIPDYQRGYAWTQKQLKDFWEDLVNLPQGRNHYTGLISLKKLDESVWKIWNDEKWLMEERDYQPFHVVDGQQRLTTFVVFVQVFWELLKDLKENKKKHGEGSVYLGSFSLKEIRESYLVIRQPPDEIINTYKFGYEEDNPSFKFLRHKIFLEQNPGIIRETFYTLNLENAKQFFKDNLAAYYTQHGLDGINSLFKKLTQNLKFNVHEISDDFDVFVAFETMNNRGKNLSNLELLKNRLIYLTTLYDTKELKADACTALRKMVNDAWKEVYHQLGRNKQHPLNDDAFLRAHWIMYFQYARMKKGAHVFFLLEEKFVPGNVFSKTRADLSSIQESEEVVDDEEVTDDEVDVAARDEGELISRSELKPAEIKAYAGSLQSAAVHWYNSHNPKSNPDLTRDERTWLDRLNRIEIAYFRPLVVASYLHENVTPKDRVRLFSAIERFIFVAFRLSGAKQNWGDSMFYKAASTLRKKGRSTIDGIIDDLNRRLIDWYFYSPEDSDEFFFDYKDFKSAIDKHYKSSEDGFYAWRGLGYFLYEYEMAKVQDRGSEKIDWAPFVKNEKDRVSIEHIYPRTPTEKCWKDSFRGCNNLKKRYLQGSLGNLLPLSKSINSSLQNKCFSDKKKKYLDGSHSEIEVATEYDEWNANSIYSRGLKLLRFMEKRWSLKFENEEDMAEMLFLNFMHEEE